MKTNRYLRSAFWTLMLTILAASLFVGSGTFAKYTANAATTASARVAQFSVFVGSDAENSDVTQIAQSENEFTLADLFASITEWQGDSSMNEDYDNVEANAGGYDNEVCVSEGNAKIAPGTKGKLGLFIANESEVDVMVKLSITIGEIEFGEGVDMPYGYTGASLPAAIAQRIAFDVAAGGDIMTTGVHLGYQGKPSPKDTYNTNGTEPDPAITWEWDIGTEDDVILDTWLGAHIFAGDVTIPIELTVEAVQVD